MKAALGLTLATATLVVAADVLYCVSPGINELDRVAASAPANAAESLAELAPKIKFLCKDALFNEGNAYFPTASPEFRSLREQLANPIFDAQHLLPLLHTRDPKVRTLAVVLLALKDDPQVLPMIAHLANDQTPTYPCIRVAPGIRSSVFGEGPTAQTVSDIATFAVTSYLEAADYYYGINGVHGQPGFEAYWATHKDRSYSASWFAVRLRRANSEASAGSVSRPSAERQRAVAEIAKLPAPDRQWTLLWLAASHRDFYGRSSLLSDNELVQICTEIGRPALLEMLGGHLPISDPDLQPRQGVNNGPYRAMIEAVLQLSEQLLDRGDSPGLLRDELIQSSLSSDPVITGWWSIAAARLDRSHAGKILHDALPRLSDSHLRIDRARIVAALWEIVGTSEEGFVLNWFFREPPAGCCVTPRKVFLESVAMAAGGWPRLASLVADPRFDSLDWVELDSLVRIINQRSRPQFITEDQLREASHPYGIGCFDGQRERAGKEYPRQTQELLATLANWRMKIRETAPIWGRARPPWVPGD